MTTKQWLAVAMVAATVGVTAAEAAPAKPKPWTQTYDVFLPEPWAAKSPGATDCAGAPHGMSKHIRTVTLAPGQLTAHLKGHVGEWFLEIYDGNGKRLAGASSIGTGHVVGVRSKARRQVYKVAVCNFAGGPAATVTLTYKPS